ncbi:hypothetical protein [Methanoregula sp. UBA64]|jgi:hypothetical protein|uniref:hypothetical protein n=1 Tax=Methanoregula sp. UBA64 TaxID=1915554 RepID=UPI0025FA8014|nr:hypothetical protein [Methanoregula sp. UBA64]
MVYQSSQTSMQTKFGDYSIVFTRLGILLDHLIQMSKAYPYEFTRGQFVEITKLKPTSTAAKLQGMEQFGLVRKTGNIYKISDLGQKIIYGGTERTRAIEAVVRSIPLWSILLTNVGKNPDLPSFARSVKQITRIDDITLQENIEKLFYAFMEDVACINRTPPFSKYSVIYNKSESPKVLGSAITTVDSKIMSHNIEQNIEKKIAEVTQKEVVMTEVRSDGEPMSASVTTGSGVSTEMMVQSNPLDSAERKFDLTIIVHGESIPVIDEESYRFAEFLLKRRGKELGIE